ncbi:ribosome hibernation-promoting factor, HPF/YfiA family [Thermoactinomyces sp. DSM 45892]|uniref:ribosome hibernation-promoting factor, HPF/YfiA family n=1 Tax=Thermoactinomyces sp. DSM 45892 TaxID=1882753 RepID=UPI0008951DFE|nr:ribosome-associated translation inhibitor RaiA [Thermoactinomyces sp. DSM 45892]SDZ20799.1 putative sigma-54 modulation protein [Thermoactinomyces sp. DSM 45892]
MDYIVRGNNVVVTDALREYVEKRLAKLERYLISNDTSEAHVSLTVQGNKDQHKVEVTIPFPGLLLRAEDQGEDMYASIDLVVEKLERQVRKYKTRIHRKARQEGSLRSQYMEEALAAYSSVAATAVEEEWDSSSLADVEIVRTKRFQFKPMGMDEAVLQMDMLSHNFFVFENAETDEVNVVYRRKDGKYGLIAPE